MKRIRIPFRLPRRAWHGPWAGIEIGQVAVKFVVLSRRNHRILIDHFAYLEIPDTASPKRAEALRDALQEIRESCPVRDVHVAAVAGGLDVAVHMVQLPKGTPSSRFRQAAIFQAMAQNPGESRDLVWNAVRQGTDEEGRLLALVASAPRSLVREMAATLSEADLRPDLITVPPLTLRLLAPEDPESGNTAVVDIGCRTTTVTVFHARNLIYSRDTRVGSGLITQELAESLGGDVALAEMVKRHWTLPKHGKDPVPVSIGSESYCIDPNSLDSVKLLTEELVRSLRYVEDRAGIPVRQVVLTGGGSQLKGLADHLNLEQPVVVADAAHHAFPEAGSPTVNRPLLDAMAPSLTRAVTAAYLGLENSAAARLNLLDDHRPDTPTAGLPAATARMGWIRAVAYGAVFVVASHALVRAAEGHLERQRDAFAALESEWGNGDGTQAPPPTPAVPWSEALTTISGMLPAEIELDRVETLNIGDAPAAGPADPELGVFFDAPEAATRSGIRLQGAAKSRRALGDFLVALRGTDGMGDAWLEWTRRPEEGGPPHMRFSLVVTFAAAAENPEVQP